MSRYLILLLLNLPFIILAILGAITKYKLKRLTKKQFVIQTTTWILVFIGLLSAESIYNLLFQANLTQTEPLSLFDVIQITAIVIILYITTRSRAKIEVLEKRIKDLHQELSIILSNADNL